MAEFSTRSAVLGALLAYVRRKKHGATQSDLAFACRVSQGHASRMERGVNAMSANQLIAATHAIGTTPPRFLQFFDEFVESEACHGRHVLDDDDLDGPVRTMGNPRETSNDVLRGRIAEFMETRFPNL